MEGLLQWLDGMTERLSFVAVWDKPCGQVLCGVKPCGRVCVKLRPVGSWCEFSKSCVRRSFVSIALCMFLVPGGRVHAVVTSRLAQGSLL